MTTAIQNQNGTMDTTAIEKVLLGGDLKELTSQQRVAYYKSVCDSLGLNPLTKPFDFLNLSGKLVLYARRDCAEQLRKNNSITTKITGREMVSGVYVVTALARDPSGREDESTGAVFADGLRGEALANAMMKAETKAKRRVTLSICGLGILDETEVDSIPGARVHVEETPAVKQPKNLNEAATSDDLHAADMARITEAQTIEELKMAFALTNRNRQNYRPDQMADLVAAKDRRKAALEPPITQSEPGEYEPDEAVNMAEIPH